MTHGSLFVLRFCGDALPDWRHVPPAGFALDGAAPPPPPAVEAPPAYMRISYNGRRYGSRETTKARHVQG
jgi:hypothetical protein